VRSCIPGISFTRHSRIFPVDSRRWGLFARRERDAERDMETCCVSSSQFRVELLSSLSTATVALDGHIYNRGNEFVALALHSDTRFCSRSISMVCLSSKAYSQSIMNLLVRLGPCYCRRTASPLLHLVHKYNADFRCAIPLIRTQSWVSLCTVYPQPEEC